MLYNFSQIFIYVRGDVVKGMVKHIGPIDNLITAAFLVILTC